MLLYDQESKQSFQGQIKEHISDLKEFNMDVLKNQLLVSKQDLVLYKGVWYGIYVFSPSS